MHGFLHILAIAALVVGGAFIALVVLVLAFFARASANGDNPFE